MQSHPAASCTNRFKWALVGGGLGVAVGLAATLIIVSTGGAMPASDAGFVVLLAALSGVVTGWLAGG